MQARFAAALYSKGSEQEQEQLPNPPEALTQGNTHQRQHALAYDEAVLYPVSNSGMPFFW